MCCDEHTSVGVFLLEWFLYFGYIPTNGIAGSNGSLVSSFFRNLQIAKQLLCHSDFIIYPKGQKELKKNLKWLPVTLVLVVVILFFWGYHVSSVDKASEKWCWRHWDPDFCHVRKRKLMRLCKTVVLILKWKYQHKCMT